MDSNQPEEVSIRPWSEGDLGLLERLLGDPRMTEHLGGPEPRDKLRARHERYLRDVASGEPLFAIVVGSGHVAVGWVGAWESEWQAECVWEIGWNVLPDFQGHGVATRGTVLTLARLRASHRHRYVHAFPSVDNRASNALCARLGFELLGETDVEYPRGHTMRSNDWRLDLLSADNDTRSPQSGGAT